MSTTIFTDVNARVTVAGVADAINEQLFGEKLGLMTRLLGCRHRNLSRPFSRGRQGYRACMNCGARRQFDPVTLETFGSFYAPPKISV